MVSILVVFWFFILYTKWKSPVFFGGGVVVGGLQICQKF